MHTSLHAEPTYAPYHFPTPAPHHFTPTPAPHHFTPTPAPHHFTPTPTPYHLTPTPHSRGAFSEVWKAQEKKTGQMVAIKVIDRKSLKGKEEALQNEVAVLRR